MLNEEIVDEFELKLAQVWSRILNQEFQKIMRNTSFFELGGDSISAIQLVNAAKELGLHLTTASIFTNPTIRLMTLAAEQHSVLNIPKLQLR